MNRNLNSVYNVAGSFFSVVVSNCVDNDFFCPFPVLKATPCIVPYPVIPQARVAHCIKASHVLRLVPSLRLLHPRGTGSLEFSLLLSPLPLSFSFTRLILSIFIIDNDLQVLHRLRLPPLLHDFCQCSCSH